MTLSTAIRLGPTKLCPLQSAVLAGFAPYDGIRYRDRLARCPKCGYQTGLLALVMHLFDVHRWTHQEVADLIEQHEVFIDPRVRIPGLVEV